MENMIEIYWCTHESSFAYRAFSPDRGYVCGELSSDKDDLASLIFSLPLDLFPEDYAEDRRQGMKRSSREWAKEWEQNGNGVYMWNSENN
jgi:hypothetical protein